MNELTITDDELKLIHKSLLMKINSIQFLALDSTLEMKRHRELDKEFKAHVELIDKLLSKKYPKNYK